MRIITQIQTRRIDGIDFTVSDTALYSPRCRTSEVCLEQRIGDILRIIFTCNPALRPADTLSTINNQNFITDAAFGIVDFNINNGNLLQRNLYEGTYFNYTSQSGTLPKQGAFTGNYVSPVKVKIPAFTAPSGKKYPPYYMDVTEVTQSHFTELTGFTRYSFGQGPTLPASFITFYDAINYCNRRSESEGLQPFYQFNISKYNEHGNIYTVNNYSED